jgi:riboflavin kinase/FMN adenylyltransferase
VRETHHNDVSLGAFHAPYVETNVKLIRNLENLPDSVRSGALSIGNFDGVHRGHTEIARRLVAAARRLGGPAVVFTFDPHPATILRPERAPSPLSWTERKAELLFALGVDAVIAYPTDAAFLHQEAREFFDRVVRGRLNAKAMVEGRNFVFGRDRRGDVEWLDRFCRGEGMALEVVDPIQHDGQTVSSSLVRWLLAEGRVEEAGRLLPGPYRIHGRVVRGAQRGAKLGFPTANLGGIDTLLPREGIYAGRSLVDGRAWPAAMSLGPNPTFDEADLKVEVHLIGYEGSLYERQIEVDFLARLRDIERFASVGQLIASMDRDVAAAQEIASKAES